MSTAPAAPAPGRHRLWYVVAALTVVVGILATVAQPWIGDLAMTVMLLLHITTLTISTVLAFRNSRIDLRAARAWKYFSAGSFCSVVGDAVVAVYSLTNTPVPMPAVSDLIFGLGLFFASLGIIAFNMARATPLARWQTGLDGALIGSGLLFISWIFVMGPIYALRANWSAGQQYTLLAYPFCDVIVATIALATFRQSKAYGRFVTSTFTVGLLVLACTDSVASYIGALEWTTSPVYVGYIITSALFLVAAASPMRPASPVDVQHHESLGKVALPYVPAVLAALSTIALKALHRHFDLFLSVTGGFLLMLIFVRQCLALLDNHRLSQRLLTTVAELEKSQQHLTYQALNDPLTALPNRRFFDNYLEQNYSATIGADTAMIYLDLNDFKLANDRYGHDAGDALLIEVAARLRQSVRSSDVIVRLGGDEFAVLLPGIGHQHDAELTAMRIVDNLVEPWSFDGNDIPIRCSLGVAAGGADSVAGLMRLADIAMYSVKKAGRHGYAIACP